MKRNLATILLALFLFSGCKENRVPLSDLSEKEYLKYYEGKLFSGVAFQNWSAAQLKDEQHYQDGKQDGVRREW